MIATITWDLWSRLDRILIFRDQRAILTSPFHLEGSDAKFLVPLGLATGALIATDHRTRQFMFYLLFIAYHTCGLVLLAECRIKMRILLVEDEPSAAKLLAKGLREQGYAVDLATDGETAVYQAEVNNYDLILLDLMLPRKNGFTVCQELRSNGSTVPILMLTARDAIQDRITGLDLGADDYLIKPFDFHELLARVRVLLRRRSPLNPAIIKVMDLQIDTHSHQVKRGGTSIDLTAKEYGLLEYLARRTGEVVSRTEIAEHAWEESFDPFSNLIEVYIQRLRRKIDHGHEPKLIRTLRGEGYSLKTDGEDGCD